jgi:hypothetical protein
MEILDAVPHEVDGLSDVKRHVKRDHSYFFFREGNLIEKNLFPLELTSSIHNNQWCNSAFRIQSSEKTVVQNGF